MRWPLRRLLVTGGAGFIGANFVHYWLAAHPDDQVVVLDALTYAGNLANLAPARANPKFRLVQGDIGTPGLAERLLRDEHLTTIVHFAAETHVDRSIAGPDTFLATNVLGTHELLKAARAVGIERFHHVSTDEVYGSLGPNDPAFTEETPYAPNSPYAASKAASDHLVRAYHHTYGLPVTTSNCSNNYGPYQFPEKLVPLMVVHALEGKPLPVYGDGQNVRDWLYVEDHCRAVEAVLQRGEVGETYNIGGRSERTNMELVQLVCRYIDRAFAEDGTLAGRFPQSPAAQGRETVSLLTFVRDRPGHDRRYGIDDRKAARLLGFASSVTLEEGLRRTVEWYLQHESWWREVMSGEYRAWIRHWYEGAGRLGQ